MKTGLAVATVLLAAVTQAWAQEKAPELGVHWSAGEIADIIAKIERDAKSSARGSGLHRILTTSAYGLLYVTRFKSLPPETHELVDIYLIVEGAGTIQIGGELVDPKRGPEDPMLPGAFLTLGTSIRGGRMIDVAVGDIVHVPSNEPHMWHFKDGQHVSFLAMKAPAPK